MMGIHHDPNADDLSGYLPEYAPVPVHPPDDPYADPDAPEHTQQPADKGEGPLWGKGSVCGWCRLDWKYCQCDQDAAQEIRERKLRGRPDRYCGICGAPADDVICRPCYELELGEDYDREDT
jgi:hypothetical protein